MAARSSAPTSLVAYCDENCATNTPLTTQFVAPSSCSHYWTPIDYSVVGYSGERKDVAFLTRNYTVSDCVPTQLRQQHCGDCERSSGIPWISPGLCPQGFRIASRGINGNVGGNITTDFCCPPEAPTYGPNLVVPTSLGPATQACTGMRMSEVRTLSFNSTLYASTSNIVAATATTEITTTTTLYVAQFFAPPFVIRYKQEDFDATFASLSTALSSLSTTSQSTSSASSPSASSSPGVPPPSGLSTGAKAGIGVGSALGVLAFLILGSLAYRARGKRRVAPTPTGDSSTSELKAELHSQSVQLDELPNENPQPRELPAGNVHPKELAGEQVLVKELPAEYVQPNELPAGIIKPEEMPARGHTQVNPYLGYHPRSEKGSAV